MKDLGPQPASSSTMPTLLFTEFCNAKRLWTQTSQKFRNAKRCYLQGSTKIKGCPKQPKCSAMPNNVIYRVPQCQKGFGPKQPPRSSAMPNAVIYRVPQRLQVLAPKKQKFQKAKHCYLTGSAMPKGFGPKPPRRSAMPNTVIYRVPQCHPNLPKFCKANADI